MKAAITFSCLQLAALLMFQSAIGAQPAQSERKPDLGDLSGRTGNWKKAEPIPTPWHFYDVDMISATEATITGENKNSGKKPCWDECNPLTENKYLRSSK